jgi:hypothetical protein
MSHLRVRGDEATSKYHYVLGSSRQQHLHLLVPPRLQVLRFGRQLCDITWGLQQVDLDVVHLNWRQVGTARAGC